jgi:hypothetical protein
VSALATNDASTRAAQPHREQRSIRHFFGTGARKKAVTSSAACVPAPASVAAPPPVASRTSTASGSGVGGADKAAEISRKNATTSSRAIRSMLPNKRARSADAKTGSAGGADKAAEISRKNATSESRSIRSMLPSKRARSADANTGTLPLTRLVSSSSSTSGATSLPSPKVQTGRKHKKSAMTAWLAGNEQQHDITSTTSQAEQQAIYDQIVNGEGSATKRGNEGRRRSRAKQAKPGTIKSFFGSSQGAE